MEQEAMMSRRVNELRHQLESARHESQDRTTKVTGARATATEREIDAAKVHLVENKAML